MKKQVKDLTGEEIIEEAAFSPLAFTKDFLRQPKNQPGKFRKDNLF